MISLRGVGYSYSDTGRPALEDVSLEVRQGEWIALVGSNGSGKSTLAKHLNALLVPMQGACFISGLDSRDENNLWKIRETVSMVFQNPENQIVSTVVEDDVAFGPENLGLPAEEIRSRVDKALRTCGLTEKTDKAVYTLSGGQKQRLAIAGALAMGSRCLVLEEPTAMLDPAGSEPEERLRYFEPSWEYLTETVSPEENYIRTACASGEGKLLMYRDSFGNSLLPYLAEHFGEAVFSRVVPYTMTELVSPGADVLIVEKVERHLPTLAEIAPVMSAPVRDPAILGEASGGKVLAAGGEASPAGTVPAGEATAEGTPAGASSSGAKDAVTLSAVPGYTVVSGGLDPGRGAPDADTPVLILARDEEKSILYEAFCVTIKNNDFGYTAYISDYGREGDILGVRVYARSGGAWTQYAEYGDMN